MSEEVIKVNHLSKSFGKHVVLRDFDFSGSTGDVTCIIGASGSGKSTLLRCMNLLDPLSWQKYCRRTYGCGRIPGKSWYGIPEL